MWNKKHLREGNEPRKRYYPNQFSRPGCTLLCSIRPTRHGSRIAECLGCMLNACLDLSSCCFHVKFNHCQPPCFRRGIVSFEKKFPGKHGGVTLSICIINVTPRIVPCLRCVNDLKGTGQATFRQSMSPVSSNVQWFLATVFVFIGENGDGHNGNRPQT